MRMRDDEASSGMSEITVDSAEAVGDRGGATSSDLDYVALGSKRMKWTNEKHCLYLKAMEASFVSELHCSMGLCKGRAQHYALEKESSVQLKKFRDGSWKNVSLYEYGNKSEAENKSPLVMANPSIKHFRQVGKDLDVDAMTSLESHVNPDEEIESKMNPFLGSDSNSKQLVATQSNLCRHDSIGSKTEESGQNFDTNDEVMSSKSTRQAKRKRTETASNSKEDQVVPFKDFSTSKAPNDIALNQ